MDATQTQRRRFYFYADLCHSVFTDGCAAKRCSTSVYLKARKTKKEKTASVGAHASLLYKTKCVNYMNNGVVCFSTCLFSFVDFKVPVKTSVKKKKLFVFNLLLTPQLDHSSRAYKCMILSAEVLETSPHPIK